MTENDTLALKSINGHRSEIDCIDDRIAQLLNERATHSIAIRDLKPSANMQLFDAQREEDILARLSRNNKGPLFNDDIKEIYATILKVMKGASS